MNKLHFLRTLLLIVFTFLLFLFVFAHHVITITVLPNDEYFKLLSANLPSQIATTRPYKIGIVYPSDSIGEKEEAKRICIAAKKLSWQCYIFEYNWEFLRQSDIMSKLYKLTWGLFTRVVGVDFIIELYPAIKPVSPLVRIPTYLALTQNMSATLANISASLELNNEPQVIDEEVDNRENYKYYFWKNIGDYDGYIDAGYRYGWLTKFDLSQYTSQPLAETVLKPIMEGYPSVYATNFIPLEYKKLFYCGDNSDNLRNSPKYKVIMSELEKKGYFQVFGPPDRWQYLTNAYKGFVASDGVALLKKMQDNGISLILHSKENLRDSIPTGRIFEAAAASTVIISDANKFIKDEFGNCVLYIDVKKPAYDIVAQIDTHMSWIKSHPEQARAKAKCAHEKFRQKFLLETLLVNIASVYEQDKLKAVQENITAVQP
jgi:glycosyltransferase involved in cell wall biosynthesis